MKSPRKQNIIFAIFFDSKKVEHAVKEEEEENKEISRQGQGLEIFL